MYSKKYKNIFRVEIDEFSKKVMFGMGLYYRCI